MKDETYLDLVRYKDGSIDIFVNNADPDVDYREVIAKTETYLDLSGKVLTIAHSGHTFTVYACEADTPKWPDNSIVIDLGAKLTKRNAQSLLEQITAALEAELAPATHADVKITNVGNEEQPADETPAIWPVSGNWEALMQLRSQIYAKPDPIAIMIHTMMNDYDAAEKANDIEQIRRVLATATEYFSALQKGSTQRFIFIEHLVKYSAKDMRRAAFGLLVAIRDVEPNMTLIVLMNQIEDMQNEWRKNQAPSTDLPEPSESK